MKNSINFELAVVLSTSSLFCILILKAFSVLCFKCFGDYLNDFKIMNLVFDPKLKSLPSFFHLIVS